MFWADNRALGARTRFSDDPLVLKDALPQICDDPKCRAMPWLAAGGAQRIAKPESAAVSSYCPPPQQKQSGKQCQRAGPSRNALDPGFHPFVRKMPAGGPCLAADAFPVHRIMLRRDGSLLSVLALFV